MSYKGIAYKIGVVSVILFLASGCAQTLDKDTTDNKSKTAATESENSKEKIEKDSIKMPDITSNILVYFDKGSFSSKALADFNGGKALEKIDQNLLKGIENTLNKYEVELGSSNNSTKDYLHIKLSKFLEHDVLVKLIEDLKKLGGIEDVEIDGVAVHK